SPAGGRGDRLPLPVRDRLAGPPGRLRALADGVEAPPRLVWRRNLGPHPRRAPGPRRRERGAGLVGRSRLHDLPRPPARHEPRTHHRGRRGTTRISATSLVTTPWVVPVAGSRRRSISSSTDTACPSCSGAARAKAETRRCWHHCSTASASPARDPAGRARDRTCCAATRPTPPVPPARLFGGAGSRP